MMAYIRIPPKTIPTTQSSTLNPMAITASAMAIRNNTTKPIPLKKSFNIVLSSSVVSTAKTMPLNHFNSMVIGFPQWGQTMLVLLLLC